MNELLLLRRYLQKRLKPPLQIYRRPDNTKIHCLAIQHRQSKEFNLFYLYNRENCQIDTLVEITWEGHLKEWDTMTGEEKVLDSWHANGKTYSTLTFLGNQGRLNC